MKLARKAPCSSSMMARVLPTAIFLMIASPSHSDSSKAVESNKDRSLALFRDYVEPLLKKHCYECHSHASGEANGGLVVDSRGGLLTGGELGPAVKPGEPQTSLLMKAVLYEDDRLSMPPTEKLSERDIDHLREWIETGAVDPREGPAISSQIVKAVQGPDASKLWSVKPLSVGAAPPIVDMQWPRTDIDRFLLAELETKGLSPSPAAPAHHMLRRLHYVCTGLPRGLRRSQLDLLAEINREHTAASGHDPGLESLIESNELAFRMQSEAPQALDISQESEATLRMYGIGNKPTDAFGRQCLVARRLAESGVRFIQVTNKEWDHHRTIDQLLPASCRGVDKPVAGLIADLKSRGLLDDTLVIWSGEFGRTPVGQGIADIGKKGKSALGRGHNPFGWSLFMAGGGVKRGFVHGKTDDFGYSAIQGRVHVHDLHATILHLLGLDHEKLTYMHAGRPYRLTDVYGEVVKEIVA